ncbi:hypothetical protein [Desulfopila sp. IMCC35008]|uniref:hypothetical protein n=1 Tax=Desulfopila sp. IMCC35008 TaxID=2653858 RepID=UPI0013D1DC9D|nr:hypothetical protein [Desulfopila sp. IMCC35008]
MENKEKLRVLLQHWIEHNEGHAAEFEKWRHTAEHDGEADIASAINEAITKMKEANVALEKALKSAGGKADHGDGHHHHHHHHHH